MAPAMALDAALLIIGAGPAGLLAAWAAARRRPAGGVMVVDRMPVPGAKLAVSGGGRGNVSHLATESEFAAAFGRHGRFTIPAFRSLPSAALREVLSELGIPTIVDAAGRIYPRSQSAVQVRDALFATCRQAGVRFVFGHEVQHLAPPGQSRFAWQVDSFTARAVLVAAGGQSAPRLGSNGSGFTLAKGLGYDITPPVPALTALRTLETWPSAHSGLSLPDVELSLPNKRGRTIRRGELLFTHHGMSGPVILDLSGQVARQLLSEPEVFLQLRLLTDIPDFRRLRQTLGNRTLRAWLAGHLPRALAGTLCELSGIPHGQTFSRLEAAQEHALVENLQSLPLTIRGTGGFGESMATAGGIALNQVNPATLEGRLTPRLYFAGEILDLDGPTGGWNLHWAFCSGHLVGTTATG